MLLGCGAKNSRCAVVVGGFSPGVYSGIPEGTTGSDLSFDCDQGGKLLTCRLEVSLLQMSPSEIELRFVGMRAFRISTEIGG